MVDKSKTFWRSENTYIAGGVAKYKADAGTLYEDLTLFVSPKLGMCFDKDKLCAFQKSLEVKDVHGGYMLPCWRRVILENGGEMDVFSFGSLYYVDQIRSVGDLSNPDQYLNGLIYLPYFPQLDVLTSTRSLSVHVYPSRLYADQIYAYNQRLTPLNKNPLMDWLGHSVTQEQIEAISQDGEHFDLGKLPPPPLLFNRPNLYYRRVG